MRLARCSHRCPGETLKTGRAMVPSGRQVDEMDQKDGKALGDTFHGRNRT